jgi:putative colanic acid biosynthesis UDP-glucose lipid carrier transferase
VRNLKADVQSAGIPFWDVAPTANSPGIPGQKDTDLTYPVLQPGNARLKRAVDITVSLFVIVFFISWLYPFITLLIKLSSKGPVFFKQKRSGLHYRSFTCLKFRTMYLNEDANTVQASENDPRITPAGRILRKFSLDELPQFFNVLKGDMSLTGPRPHMIHHTNAYSEQVNIFLVRHLIKPGITGLSQIQGYRGEIRTNQMLRNRVRLDIFYLEKWSLGLDFLIIIKTIKLILFGDKNAY